MATGSVLSLGMDIREMQFYTGVLLERNLLDT
jgi:hypothetical protein